MTEQIVAPIKTNPTVFVVTDLRDPRLPHDPELRGFLVHLLESGPIYGTYLRRDFSFWEDEVFVCPNCIHATLLDKGENESDTFYCKYCYTDWKVVDGRLYMEWTQYNDETGDESGVVLI